MAGIYTIRRANVSSCNKSVTDILCATCRIREPPPSSTSTARIIGGASGPVFQQRLATRRRRPATDSSPSSAPIRRARVRGPRRERRSCSSTRRSPPRGDSGLARRRRARRRRGGRRRVGRRRPAVRPRRDRRAPRGRPAPRAGHHEPGAARDPVRRAPRVRRRHRHPVGERATARTPARSTGRSCGAGASCEAARPGPPTRRRRPADELRLLATATSTARSWPRSAIPSPSTPTPASPRWPGCGAGRCATSTLPGACQDRRARAAGVAAPAQPARAAAQRQLRVRRRREHPRRPARPSSCSTTAATSTPPSVDDRARPTGPHVRFLGKKEVFDAPLIGRSAEALPAASGSTRASGSDEPLEARRPRPRGPARPSPWRPQGTIPRGPAFFDPSSRAVGARPGWRPCHRRPGHPRRAVGHRGRLAPQLAASPLRPRPSARSGARRSDRSPLKHRSPDADTERIMAALVDLLPARGPRAPHADGGGAGWRTFPPGYRGDPTREPERRPGTDTVTRHRSERMAVQDRSPPAPRAALREAACPTPRR